MVGGGKITFVIRAWHPSGCLGGSKVCASAPTTQTEADLPEMLSISCGGTGLKWPAAGAGTLCAGRPWSHTQPVA